MATKLTAAQRAGMAVLASMKDGYAVRVSNRTQVGGVGPDGATPAIYWQTADRLSQAGYVKLSWILGAQHAELTDDGRALIAEGGHR